MTPDEAFQRAVQTASDLLLRWQLLNMRKMAGLTRLGIANQVLRWLDTNRPGGLKGGHR